MPRAQVDGRPLNVQPNPYAKPPHLQGETPDKPDVADEPVTTPTDAMPTDTTPTGTMPIAPPPLNMEESLPPEGAEPRRRRRRSEQAEQPPEPEQDQDK